jgi:hypothetical protein
MFGSLRGQEWTVYSTRVDSLIQITPEEALFRQGIQSVQPLLRLWDRYEKECRKDSSVCLWLEGGGFDRKVEQVDYLMLRQKDLNRIILKQVSDEPTPQGFIEWLKEKNK